MNVDYALLTDLYQITMANTLNTVLITTQITVGKYRIARIGFKWSIWIFTSRISYHMTIFCTALSNHHVIPVTDMIQVWRLQITSTITTPNRFRWR